MIVLSQVCKIVWWARFWENVLDSLFFFYTEIDYSNFTFCGAHMLSFLACHTNLAKQAVLWLVGREWDVDHRPGKRNILDLYKIKGATGRVGRSYTKNFLLNILCYPGMCSICWVLWQFMSFFIDFPTALQWKRSHLLDIKQLKFTESTRPLYPIILR